MSDQNDRDELLAEILRLEADKPHVKVSLQNALYAGREALLERARGRAAEPQGREYWIVGCRSFERVEYALKYVNDNELKAEVHQAREVPKPQLPVSEVISNDANKVMTSYDTNGDESYQPDKASYKLDKTADEAFESAMYASEKNEEGDSVLDGWNADRAYEKGACFGRDYGKRESVAEIAKEREAVRKFYDANLLMVAERNKRIAELEAELAKLKGEKS